MRHQAKGFSRMSKGETTGGLDDRIGLSAYLIGPCHHHVLPAGLHIRGREGKRGAFARGTGVR